MISLNLSYGRMDIEVEYINGSYRRVSRYYLKVGKLAGRTMVNRSRKTYKTFAGAMREAGKFADQQKQVFG